MTAKNGIHAAYVQAQAAMTNPKKGSENSFFKKADGTPAKYSNLAECWRACKDALAENNIAVMQGVFGDRLRTTLVHASGETLEDEGVPLCGYANAKNPAQALVGAITYSRRAGLCAMLGMAPEDDDGNSLVQDDTPVQILSGEQVSELNNLAEDVGANKAKFCEYLGVASLADISPKQFDIAKAALEKKRAA